MNTSTQSETRRKMDMQALRLYGILAGLIYGLALAYCYYTSHFMEVGIVGGVMLGLAILILNVYSSLRVKVKRPETEKSFKHVTQ